MANLNKVLLIGNLTRDPEVRYTPKGTAVGDITLAVNRVWNDDGGNRQEEVTFVDVTMWGRTAELAKQYLQKGTGVFIEGRLQMDTWDDKATGQKRSKLKVVADSMQFLPGQKRQDGAPSQERRQERRQEPAQAQERPPEDFDPDDDIPF